MLEAPYVPTQMSYRPSAADGMTSTGLPSPRSSSLQTQLPSGRLTSSVVSSAAFTYTYRLELPEVV